MMKPWIENISLDDVRKGHHYDAGDNSMLIQICDYNTEFPTPKHQFKETLQFNFLDVEEDDKLLYECVISNDDANSIASALQRAWDNHMNVVVHCHMGISRSGAVAEVGEMLGFRSTDKFRVPNQTVKRKLTTALNLKQY